MTYFGNFPTIDYDIRRTGNERSVIDLLRRVGIRKEVLEGGGIFQKYVVKDGERPDTISAKVYGDSKYFWMILMANNITNPNTEWPMDYQSLVRYVKLKYPGTSFYLEIPSNRDLSSSSSSSTVDEESSVSSSSSTEALETSSSSTENSSSSSSSYSRSSSSSNSSSSESSSSSISSSSSSSTLADNTSSSSSSSTIAEETSSESSSSTENLETSSSSTSSANSSSSSDSSASSSSSSEYEVNFTVGETVNFTGGATGKVVVWDSTFRHLAVDNITGVSDVLTLTGATVSGENSGADGTISRTVQYHYQALHHFEGDVIDVSGNVLVKDAYLNPLTYRNGYINGSNNYVVTNIEYESSSNDNRREIKIVKPQYIASLNVALRDILDNA